MPAIFPNSALRHLDKVHYSLRSTAATVSFWIGTVALIVVAVTPLFTANWKLALFSVPFAALLIWTLLIALHEPAIYYDEHRVVVVNFGRIWVLPWAQVTDIHQGLNLVFSLRDGREVTAAGSPSIRRRSALMPNRNSSTPRTTDGEVGTLQGFHDGASDDGAEVEVYWRKRLLWAGAVIVIVVIAASIIGAL